MICILKVIHYFWLMFLKTLEKCIEGDPAKSPSAPGLAWQAAFKRTEVKLELLTDVDMQLMVEKGIGGEICNTTHRIAKANHKHMNDYDKNKETSYPK